MHVKEERIWRVPRKLPPCYWNALHWSDGRVNLHGPHDSLEDAAEDWVYRDQKGWIDPPSRIEIVPEDASASLPKSVFGGNLAEVAARWYWFRRQRKYLLKWTNPRPCSWLIPQPAKTSRDLLTHRLGGPAVLPDDAGWPEFRAEFWPPGKRRRTKIVPGTFLATLDLRGRFPFRNRFPDAVSLFLRTEHNGSCGDPYVPEGIVVPLFSRQRLIEVNAPAGAAQLDHRSAAAFDVPDFPPQIVDLGEAFQQCGEPTAASEFYDSLRQRESGTEVWVNIRGLKIGGCEAYVQDSVREMMARKYRSLQWHYIATWVDDRVMLGDGGALYVVAGYDKVSRQWQWHCAWDCY